MKKCTKHQAIQLAATYLPKNPVILEAGAYNGKDSLYMALLWPGATFHLFEPVPSIFTRLKKNTSTLPRAYHWPLALSNQTGVTQFYVAEKKENPGFAIQAGSVLKPAERTQRSPIVYPRTIEVPTMTLDDWANQHQIDRVDFLWLDVQGHELDILKNGLHMLNNTIALFIELHFTKAYEQQPVASEVINWLDQNGFVFVARDYPEPPQWFFGNGLFIKKDSYESITDRIHL